MVNDMTKARIVILLGIVAILIVAVFGGTMYFFNKDNVVHTSWDVASTLLKGGEVERIVQRDDGVYFFLKTK